tara:strand:- start:152 stop:448 length:297 start_codon:yes stop_codon:yes gene_type:complete
MKLILVSLIVLLLAGCANGTSPTGNGSLTCFSIEAAALVQWFSTTTLVEGVTGPTDSNGDPMMTPDQLSEALDKCFADPQSQFQLELLKQLNTAQPDG